MVRRLLRNGLGLTLPATLVALAGAVLWQGTWPGLGILLLLAPIPAAATLAAVASGVLHAHGLHRRALLGPVYGSLLAGAILLSAPVQGLALAAVLCSFEVARALGLGWHAARILGPEEGRAPLAADLLAWPGRKALANLTAAAFASVNLLVDVLFASRLPVGGVTQVEYASRLWNVVPLLLSGHVLLLHARHSRGAARGTTAPGDAAAKAAGWHRDAWVVGGLGLALSVVLAAAAPWVVDLLYGFGRLGAEQREVLARLLRAYLLGAGPFLAGIVYIRALTATGRQWPVAAVAAFGMLTNVALDALLVARFEIYGIGLATSLTYLVNTAALAWIATRGGPPTSPETSPPPV